MEWIILICMEILKRNCPNCGLEKIYKTKSSFNLACKNNSKCRKCAAKDSGFLDRYATSNNSGENNPFFGKKHSPESKDKISKSDRSYCKTKKFKEKMKEVVTRGEKHHMHNSSHKEHWLKKYGNTKTEELELKRRKNISKKLSGSLNPMFGKPAPKGSGCGWKGWYKNWFFRSLRELSYVIKVIEINNWKWTTAEKRKLAIPYFDFFGNLKNYFADFLINEKTLVEIKPAKLHNAPLVEIKKNAALHFCKNLGFEYQIIDPKILSNKEINELYESKSIRFTEKYDTKYQQYRKENNNS